MKLTRTLEKDLRTYDNYRTKIRLHKKPYSIIMTFFSKFDASGRGLFLLFIDAKPLEKMDFFL